MLYKNARYWLALVVSIGAIAFLVHGYQDSHRQYAGERVYDTCAGGVVTVKSFGPGINGGGPCLTGLPYTLKNNYAEFYAAIAVFAVVVVLDAAVITRDFRKKPAKRR